MTKTLRKLAARLKQRRRKSWNDVPMWVLTLFGLVATTEAGYYGYVLQKFAPEFIDIVNVSPMASWLSVSFLACVVILSAVGVQFFVWSVAAAGSVALLQKRVFGV